MFLVDTASGRIVDDDEIKAELAAEHPYDDWLHAGLIHLDDLPDARARRAHPRVGDPPPADLRLHRGGAAAPARADGHERRRAARLDGHRHARSPCCPTGRGCSSTTSPSCSPRSPTRRWTPSARSWSPRSARTIGPEGNLLDADAGVLPPDRAAVPGASTTTSSPRSSTSTPTATCPGSRPSRRHGPLPTSPAAAQALRDAARRDLRRGRRARSPTAPGIIVLSDRDSDRRAARRSRRCCSPRAVHHHLVREKTRTQVGLVVEAGDAREVHHVALLIGYGAAAVNPYLAFETVEDLVRARRARRRRPPTKAVAQPASRRSARAC